MVGRLKKGNDEWFIEVVLELISEAGPFFRFEAVSSGELRFESRRLDNSVGEVVQV